MTRSAAFPVKKIEGQKGPAFKDYETFEHEAYGVITMTTVSGGDPVMFGSDVEHSHRIRIEIKTAELQRGLSNDWIHGRKKLLEFEMSHSQFAQFITSNGNGSGTPVTLNSGPDVSRSSFKDYQAIKKLESKADTLRREIRDGTKSQLADIAADITKFGEMLSTGKIGIKDARELYFRMKNKVGNLPSNMEFVVGQAEEALEKATTDAQIQIEAYIDHATRRLGIESLQRLEGSPIVIQPHISLE